MKRLSELKKGDVVYVYSNDTRHEGVEEKVVSIGPKYITTDGPQWRRKFEKETMTCTDWCGWNIFLGTKAEYEDYCKKRTERNQLLNVLHNYLDSLKLDDLKKVREYIYTL